MGVAPSSSLEQVKPRRLELGVWSEPACVPLSKGAHLPLFVRKRVTNRRMPSVQRPPQAPKAMPAPASAGWLRDAPERQL